eukprot:763955-Hanusia_phi.AAC.1
MVRLIRLQKSRASERTHMRNGARVVADRRLEPFYPHLAHAVPPGEVELREARIAARASARAHVDGGELNSKVEAGCNHHCQTDADEPEDRESLRAGGGGLAGLQVAHLE